MSRGVYYKVQFKLSPALVARLKNKLDDLRRIHDRDVAAFERQLKAGSLRVADLEARRIELAERQRRLTINNLFRLAAELGMRSATDDARLLEQLAAEGTPVGRPRVVKG